MTFTFTRLWFMIFVNDRASAAGVDEDDIRTEEFSGY